MTHVRLTEHYDAPIERVFDLGTDFSRYPEWNVSYTEIKQVTGPVDKVGTKVHAVMKLLGRSMDGWSEIVEVDRPKLLKMVGSGQEGSKLTVTYHLEPATTGCDQVIEIDYELPAGFLGHIADKLFVEKSVERDLRHSLENFKALVETRQPALV
jgi:uncharacterized membrane protein